MTQEGNCTSTEDPSFQLNYCCGLCKGGGEVFTVPEELKILVQQRNVTELC